jgi:hypothetical protein
VSQLAVQRPSAWLPGRLGAEAVQKPPQRLTHPHIVHGVEERTPQAALPGWIRGSTPSYGLAAAAADEALPGIRALRLKRHVPLNPLRVGRDCLTAPSLEPTHDAGDRAYALLPVPVFAFRGRSAMTGGIAVAGLRRLAERDETVVGCCGGAVTGAAGSPPRQPAPRSVGWKGEPRFPAQGRVSPAGGQCQRCARLPQASERRVNEMRAGPPSGLVGGARLISCRRSGRCPDFRATVRPRHSMVADRPPRSRKVG